MLFKMKCLKSTSKMYICSGLLNLNIFLSPFPHDVTCQKCNWHPSLSSPDSHFLPCSSWVSHCLEMMVVLPHNDFILLLCIYPQRSIYLSISIICIIFSVFKLDTNGIILYMLLCICSLFFLKHLKFINLLVVYIWFLARMWSRRVCSHTGKSTT